MFTLDEKHLDEAKQIALKHRTKKSCGTCYDRGWVGVNDENLLILCTKCVDLEASMAEWKAYVAQHEELKEHFAELFEEQEEEQSEKETDKVMPHDVKNPVAKTPKNYFIPGQKRTGLKKV